MDHIMGAASKIFIVQILHGLQQHTRHTGSVANFAHAHQFQRVGGLMAKAQALHLLGVSAQPACEMRNLTPQGQCI